MSIVGTREEFLRELNLPSCAAVEIGVLHGDFSEMILGILQPKSLALIDPFVESRDRYQNGLPTAYSTEKEYLALRAKFAGDARVSIDRRFSFDAVNDYHNVDFIYIDACHLYEAVKRDLNDWHHKLGASGFLCGHDYIDHEDFGVKRAVDEFCGEHGFEMVVLNDNGGDFALSRLC